MTKSNGSSTLQREIESFKEVKSQIANGQMTSFEVGRRD